MIGSGYKFVCMGIVFLSCALYASVLTVPAEHSTIQGAIDAAVNGDTVIVSPGTYYENIIIDANFVDDLVLTSTDPNDPNVVAATIIDGGQNGSVVTFDGGETSNYLFRGFSITNGAAIRGGGIKCIITPATIANCTITGNTASSGGGGVYSDSSNWSTSEIACPSITNCTITGNTADHGSGLVRCHGPITNCTIANNIGGGLYDCDGPITNCTISGNTVKVWDGGGLYDCDGPITNCIIIGNTAGHDGAGLYGCDGPITNCTIAGNTAWGGAGLYRCDGPITNCIIWGNSAGTSGDQLEFSETPTYSCIQDWTGGGTGNITSDPLFADTASPDPNEWDLHLLPASPCIDAGTNAPPGGLPATDIEGIPRPYDGDADGNSIADMGAYEFISFGKPYIYIEPRSAMFIALEAGDNPAAETITISNYGDQALNWSLDLAGKPAWLAIAPESGSLNQGQSQPVTLSVDITGLPAGNYSYAFNVSDPAAMNGPQNFVSQLYVIEPGAADIFVPIDYPTIQGAINAAVNGDTIMVSPGTYYENLFISDANVLNDFVLTSIDPNDSNVMAATIIDGGGNGRIVKLYWNSTNAVSLKGFTLTNGMYGGLYGCNGPITNCIIVKNTGGGLAYCDGPITNCTIVKNTGGGLAYCDGPITNCIIWGNSAGTAGNQLFSSSTPTHSCIQNWTAGGTGNINSDPLFADVASPYPNEWDLHLKSQYGRWDPASSQWVLDDATSPCIDTGNPTSYWNEELWPHGARINMGAYGGTLQASMSANANLDQDIGNAVDTSDLLIFCQDWLLQDTLLDTDLDLNGVVDIADFAIFSAQWLWSQP